MEFTRTIRRQFKRHLKKESPEDLIALLSDEEGRATERLLPVLQNLPDFFQAVNDAYADYDEKLKLSARSLELSSIELNDANRTLENLLSSLNAMMNGLGQGLLFFDREGRCSNVYSKICPQLFGVEPADRLVQDILELAGEDRDDFELWLSAVFGSSSAMGFDDMGQLAPQTFVNSSQKTIKLDYKPMRDARRNLSAILLIATDVTHELEIEEARARIEDQAAQTMAIAANRNAFQCFLHQLRDVFAGGKPPGEMFPDAAAFAFQMHTYKGLAASFYLTELSRLLHSMEGEAKNQPGETAALLEKYNGQMLLQLEAATEAGRRIFGNHFLSAGEVRILPLSSLHRLAALVKEGKTGEALGYLQRDMISVTVEDALKNFVTEISRLALIQGKPEPKIMIHADGVRIDTDRYGPLIQSFIHIARNIMDHGIAHARERTISGLPPEGQITIHAHQDRNTLLITFADDGRGINVAKLQKILHDRNIALPPDACEDDIMQTVFLPEVTTGAAVTLLSGRGVGLPAVKNEVCRLGGQISIHNASGGGAAITMVIPQGGTQ